LIIPLSLVLIIWSLVEIFKKKEKKMKLGCQKRLNDTPLFRREGQPTNAFYNLNLDNRLEYNQKFIEFVNKDNIIKIE